MNGASQALEARPKSIQSGNVFPAPLHERAQCPPQFPSISETRVVSCRPNPKNQTFLERPVPFYSITSSARVSNVDGTVRPSAFALLRLMTSSNFVGC